jgi:hypothetical protein
MQYTLQAIDLANRMKLWQTVPEVRSNTMSKAREFTAWGYVTRLQLACQCADNFLGYGCGP